jgi:type II secretory pathway pseudopilin PulG
LQPNSSAFTRLEVVVVIVVIAVIFFLAWPAFNSGLTKKGLTQTMKNGRDLYLAAFAMATDGTAKSKSELAWPGDYPATTLAEYCDKLVQNKYVQTSDLQRLLSAPAATCNATLSGPPATLVLSGRSALKIYKATGADSSDTIFAASSNYIYGTPLDAKAVPFGDAGFVVVRKSGDAGVYKKGQATPAGFESTEKFQTDIGSLPGATKGTVIAGDGGTVLANPQ